LENKRTQHVIDRAFQLWVATRLTAIAMLVPVVLLIGGYLVWTFAVIHNPGLAKLPFGWKLFSDLMKEQWWLVMFFVATFLAFSFALVFYNTHRIAGPVYRFRWLCDELAEGRIHTRVKLREGDCFENLASSMLRANVTLASSISHVKAAAAAVSQEANVLQHGALNEQAALIIRALDRFTVISAPVEPSPETSDENPEAVPPA